MERQQLSQRDLKARLGDELREAKSQAKVQLEEAVTKHESEEDFRSFVKQSAHHLGHHPLEDINTALRASGTSAYAVGVAELYLAGDYSTRDAKNNMICKL